MFPQDAQEGNKDSMESHSSLGKRCLVLVNVIGHWDGWELPSPGISLVLHRKAELRTVSFFINAVITSAVCVITWICS